MEGAEERGEFAARVRAARAYAGLSQPELAQRLGRHEGTIHRWESGTQRVGRDQLLAVGAACGVPEAFMIDGFAAVTTMGEVRDAVQDLADQLRAQSEAAREPEA